MFFQFNGFYINFSNRYLICILFFAGKKKKKRDETKRKGGLKKYQISERGKNMRKLREGGIQFSFCD